MMTQLLILLAVTSTLLQCSTEEEVHRSPRADTQGAEPYNPYGQPPSQDRPSIPPSPWDSNGSSTSPQSPPTFPQAPQPPIGPQPQPPSGGMACHKAPSTFICELEARIVEHTNRVRSSRGLTAFHHSQQLSFVSRDWSEQMLRTRVLSHFGFPSTRERVFTQEFGTRLSLSAENVAMRTYSQNSSAETLAQAIVDSWVASRGHLMNIVGSHRTLGAGVAVQGSTLYATQLFSRSEAP